MSLPRSWVGPERVTLTQQQRRRAEGKLSVMSNRDLTFLPIEVQQSARLADNGHEVMWPRAEGPTVLAALASAGRVVLGLDLRRYDAEGAFFEASWSSFDPMGAPDSTKVDAARDSAIEALRRADEGDWDHYQWVLVSWRDE